MIELLLPAASTYARDIDALFTLILVLVGFWFLLSEGIFFGLLIRFRKREGVAPEYVTGEEKSQKRWINWPHMLILIFDIFIVIGAVQVWYDIKQNLPPAQETIRVIGQQWAWTFIHPGPDGQLDTDDVIDLINDLHVKVGTLYHYQLESKDVIHSFSVPVFRLKQDAIPGRVITGWFEPTRTGEWDIHCAEICGIGHGLMGGRIHIESPAQHAAWMGSQAPTRLIAASLAGQGR